MKREFSADLVGFAVIILELLSLETECEQKQVQAAGDRQHEQEVAEEHQADPAGGQGFHLF